MNNPFEINRIKRSMKPGKNLSFEEAYMGLKMTDAEVMDDEREDINYRALGLIIIFCLAVLFGRIFFLQAIQGGSFQALAEGNKLRTQHTLAPRGLLADRYGKVIAGNTPSFELVAVTADFPKDATEFEGRLTQVASILGVEPASLTGIVHQLTPASYEAQTLVEDITKDQALVLIAKADDLKGFVVQNNPIRDYKDALAFSSVTGYTGKITAAELQSNKGSDYILNDYIGKSGVELVYEKYLRGLAGKRQAEVDAEGHFQKTLAEVPAVPGLNVKLNLDYDMQKVLYDSLTAMLLKVRATKAAAVITNPQTGEVLSLVSLPSFDSNQFAQGIKTNQFNQLINNPDNPLLNRVVAGQYPPGSTIKPVMAMAGLSEGIITASTKILDDGLIRVGVFNFYGYEHSGLGVMDVYTAIARSSDIYFYTMGGGNLKTGVAGLGPDKMATWFRKFNLGATLGIDLPNEKPGLVPDPDWKERVKKEPWYLGDTYHAAIGQGDVLSTPLQVNSWTATIANGGKIMQPYLLGRVDDKNGRELAKGQPKILAQNIFDPAYIKIVQDGMRLTVTDGSGRSLNNLPITVSAKTGTAQFDPVHPDRYHAWFTSYAPSENAQIAVTVLVEAGGEGYAVAGPVTKDVYQWWAENRYNK